MTTTSNVFPDFLAEEIAEIKVVNKEGKTVVVITNSDVPFLVEDDYEVRIKYVE